MVETLSYPIEVKAKKHHRCDFCNERIMKGSKYLNGTFKFDGQVYSWKTHKRCSEIADRLEMYKTVEHTGYGLSGDDFQEIISDEYFDLLIKTIPEKLHKSLSDVIGQLGYVRFRAKLNYVIRHYYKIDNHK